MDLTTLTPKEIELYESLIQLGDSEEVAYQTVIDTKPIREMQEQAREFYRTAYGYGES